MHGIRQDAMMGDLFLSSELRMARIVLNFRCRGSMIGVL
jgi:hypothetical protein